eukprot:TRINITY_DN5058_c0_g1_i7.p1 TRINITY_DN5058_c0_g1~~TRINITY_DN5058_c0_g1_i7.p1  ORF type:complete len:588 (-),score=56.00 TRINITY_DN5058_c0_g1_i7:17-1780(-)
MITKVVIVGAGIGGLTLCNGLKKIGVSAKVFERNPVIKATLGGGIGLWRNSLKCFSSIGMEKDIISDGSFMPSPSYLTQEGSKLASPTKNFSKVFPILCMDRSDLHNRLALDVESNIVFGKEFTHFHDDGNKVIVYFKDGTSEEADLLVGADGIHSQVRSQMFKDILSDPYYCGYTYYRANITCTDAEYDKIVQSDIGAFETWSSDGRRFGLVPLKKPTLFWFVSEKCSHDDTSRSFARPIDHQEYENIKRRYANDTWHEPIPWIVSNTDPNLILKTDIYRLPTLKSWTKSRVVLLGDSCHATAPNLAQGAGLAIEDSIQLVYNIQKHNVSNQKNIQRTLIDYENERKYRAMTVQTLADLIAFIGQIENKTLNNVIQKTFKYTPSLVSEYTFEQVVRLSLGWNYKAPPVSKASESLFYRILGQHKFESLFPSSQRYRLMKGGHGKGTSEISWGTSIISKFIAYLALLPKPAKNVEFIATTKVVGDCEIWSRSFGGKISSSTMKEWNGQLLESRGGVSFAMNIDIKNDNLIEYTSNRCWVFGIPIPKIIAPKSKWTEEGSKNGWKFDGDVSSPLFGKILEYKGNFEIL